MPPVEMYDAGKYDRLVLREIVKATCGKDGEEHGSYYEVESDRITVTIVTPGNSKKASPVVLLENIEPLEFKENGNSHQYHQLIASQRMIDRVNRGIVEYYKDHSVIIPTKPITTTS